MCYMCDSMSYSWDLTNYYLNMSLTLFQLASAANKLMHFITAPYVFPKANPLGFIWPQQLYFLA